MSSTLRCTLTLNNVIISEPDTKKIKRERSSKTFISFLFNYVRYFCVSEADISFGIG